MKPKATKPAPAKRRIEPSGETAAVWFVSVMLGVATVVLVALFYVSL